MWTPPGHGLVERADVLVGVAAVFAVGLALAGTAALLFHLTIVARRPDGAPLGATLLRAVPIATVSLVAVSLFWIARADLAAGRAAGPVAGPEFPGQTTPPLEIVGWFDRQARAVETAADEVGPASEQDGDGRLPLVIGLLSVVGLAAVAVVSWLLRRKESGEEEDESLERARRAAARGAVVGTIDAMLSDPDPKTAVIGAYARLLEGLGAAGASRRPFEGPEEHLHRVLGVLRVRPGPLRHLVELFEVARFSTHVVTSEHREEALDALRAVAADLADEAGASVPARTASGSAGAPS